MLGVRSVNGVPVRPHGVGRTAGATGPARAVPRRSARSPARRLPAFRTAAPR